MSTIALQPYMIGTVTIRKKCRSRIMVSEIKRNHFRKNHLQRYFPHWIIQYKIKMEICMLNEDQVIDILEEDFGLASDNNDNDDKKYILGGYAP